MKNSSIVCYNKIIIDEITDTPTEALVFYCDAPEKVFDDFAKMILYADDPKIEDMKKKAGTLVQSEFTNLTILDQLAEQHNTEKTEPRSIMPNNSLVPFCAIEIYLIENSIISKMRILKKDGSLFFECDLYGVRSESDIKPLRMGTSVFNEVMFSFMDKKNFNYDLPNPADLELISATNDGKPISYSTTVPFINFKYFFQKNKN